MAVASARVGIEPCMPVKLHLSKESHLQVIVVGLEATSAILACPLCADPMLTLVAILKIFRATLDSLLVAPKDNA